jgi:hypothetical protein
MKICRTFPNLVKIGQKYLAVYIKAEEHSIAVGVSKSS